MTLLDPFFLKHKASRLSAASFIIAAHSLKKQNSWGIEIEKITGIKRNELKTVIEDIQQFIVEVNKKFVKSLKYKFEKNEFLNVALIQLTFPNQQAKGAASTQQPSANIVV